jgi:hypothetical protein
MIDEIFDRTYQSGRAELNAGLHRAFTKIGRIFSRPSGHARELFSRPKLPS